MRTLLWLNSDPSLTYRSPRMRQSTFHFSSPSSTSGAFNTVIMPFTPVSGTARVRPVTACGPGSPSSTWVRPGEEGASNLRSRLTCLSNAPLRLPVHEARGLDVNPHTIEKFRKAGDLEAVEALEIIHSDEVTHVTAGHKVRRSLRRSAHG